jgi:hypothetical protein
MEAQVRLAPLGASASAYPFDKAIFSNSTTDDLPLHNSTVILGDGTGDNADVYANEDNLLINSAQVHGDVIAQGTVRLRNSVKVWGNVLAKGNVTVDNSVTVYGNIISSTGSVTMANSPVVTGYVRAATTITPGNSWTIGSSSGSGGSCSAPACFANSPSAAPPQEFLPTFTWNAADPAWPQPVSNYASCTAFMTYMSANKSNFKGTHRINSNCGALWTNSWDITMTGDAAIVTDGYLDFNNSIKFTGNKNLYLISLCTPVGQPGACANAAYGIDMRNSTDLSGVNTLVFARNRATKRNSTKLKGQIYAQVVQIDNSFELTYKKMGPPGFTVYTGGGGGGATPTGFGTQLLYLREVN